MYTHWTHTEFHIYSDKKKQLAFNIFWWKWVEWVAIIHSFIHFVSRKLSMIMWSPSSSYRPLPLLLLLIIFASCVNATRPNPRNGSVSAFFVFGDSTVDSGNNNFIKTISKSNFPPYGKDLPNHIPTGRFTNGRLATDFLGNYYFYLSAIFFFPLLFVM